MRRVDRVAARRARAAPGARLPAVSRSALCARGQARTAIRRERARRLAPLRPASIPASRGTAFCRGRLALAEDAIPSERLFDLFIAYERPDLVLVTPLVDYGSYQTDYVKSAHRVGVPVVFAPFSWDNLTNRGLIRVEPDRMLVWNEIQKSEAVELHGVSPERVDRHRRAAVRRVLCHASLGAARGLLPWPRPRPRLPVCPVSLLFRVRGAARGRVRQAMDCRSAGQRAIRLVRTCGVLVRPAPGSREAVEGREPVRSFANVALWHEKETMNADQGLFDSLHHSSAVVGLNTSAMIEAGILEKPVLSLVMRGVRRRPGRHAALPLPARRQRRAAARRRTASTSTSGNSAPRCGGTDAVTASGGSWSGSCVRGASARR